MNSFDPSEILKKNYYSRDLRTKSTWYSEVAIAYDRVRPRYDDELIELAVQSAKLPPKAKILEIGSASGIATTAFAERGFNLTCLEPNSAACQLARENCAIYPQVKVCQTTLEEWSVEKQEFDAVLAATSLHWVSPEIGYLKIFQGLKPEGYLILLWNAGLHPDREIQQLLEPIYQDKTPSLKPFQNREQEKQGLLDLTQTVIDSGYFQHLISKELIITVNYSLENYLLLLSTYSPYINLKDSQRQNLLMAIKDCLEQNCQHQLDLSYLSMVQVFKKDNQIT